MKTLVVAVIFALATMPTVNARGYSYGGGSHTSSHGGRYSGGVGSSHRGGTYHGPHGGYGTHR